MEQLLLLGVAVDPDDLHPVQQRSGDGLGHVGRRDEQDLGQVQLDLEVVVPEGVVLGRVEDLEQSRGRVAAVVGTQLVDLVQDDDRVHGPRLAQSPGQPARLGPDVGPPVPPDLGLVVHPAERDAHELASEGAGHRLAERGLAHARGADEGQDGAGAAPADGDQAALGLQARTARCSRIRSFTSSARRGPRRGPGRPRSRRGGLRRSTPQGISSTVSSQVRIQPCSGLCSLVRSSLVDLALDRRADGLGQLAGRDQGPVVLGGARRRRCRRARPAPCGWRRAGGAAGTRAGSSPSPLRRCVLICSRRVRSASVSRAQPRTRRSRASTSTVSRTSTFCARDRSGE